MSAAARVEQCSLRAPSRELWLLLLREAVWITCLWLAVYGGASWITGQHEYRVRLGTRLDSVIPFVPAAAVAYLSLFPMFWLAPLVLRTRDQVISFSKSLAWLIVLSGVAFLLIPSDEPHPPQHPAGFFGGLHALADHLNLNYNFFPSLHVGMAVVCAWAYGRCAARWLAVCCWLWAAAISLSTLLTHQHYVVDVVAGAALACLISLRQAPRRQ